MQYLREEACALTACAFEELPALLDSAFFGDFSREETVTRALDAARKNHDTEKNSRRLYALLQEVSR